MKKYKAAIIGCGAIYPMHAEALKASTKASLYAVCDIVEERAKAAAQKYGCKYYTDYRNVLKDPEVDTVHICLPHYLHAPVAIEAMQAGKNVLTEKPMAIHTADAEKMIAVSRETGKKLGICFQNRYNSTSVRIKELLDSGKTGRILGARAIVTWHKDRDYYDSGEWRGTWEQEGGGVLINQSIHTLDLVQWFLGEVDGLKGNADTRLLGDFIEVEDTADATISFKSGATALFYATNCYAVTAPIELEIACEKALIRMAGELTITYKNGEAEHVADTDTRTGQKSYWGCGHAVLIEDYYNKLDSGEKFPIDGEQAITTIKLIEAIYASTKSGKYVKI